MVLNEGSPFWLAYKTLCWHGSYRAADSLKKAVEALPELNNKENQ
jgi:hypothetical protein